MAELWYYTTEGKQMDPVTIVELQLLAVNGTLKPTDMVWNEGLPRWVRANSVKELFPNAGAAIDHHHTPPKPGAPLAPTGAVEVPVPATAKAPSAVDEAPRGTGRRRPAEDESFGPARRQPKTGPGSFGIVAALIVGAVLLLGSLGVGLVILLVVNPGGAVGKINPTNLVKGEATFNLALGIGATDSRKFSFRKGVGYEIKVLTQPKGEHVDVDIHIFDSAGHFVTKDDLPDSDCFVRWTPEADGEYRLDIMNLNQPRPGVPPAVPVTCVVAIKEAKEQPIIDKKDPPKDEPLPFDTLEGKGFKDFTISTAKKEQMQKFRVKAGHKATFTFLPSNPNGKTNFDIVVIVDSDPEKKIAEDVGPEARASVTFTRPTTEIVQVRIINSSGKGGGTGRGVLNYDASP